MKQEPQPWEYRSKPAWQRFFVIFGGVLFNFILAIVIYTGILAAWGEEYIKNSDVTTGVRVNELAYEIGFRNGDRIISFEDYRTDNFQELQVDLIRTQAKYARVIRDNDTITVNIDESYIPAILNTRGMFDFGIPYIIAAIPDSSIKVNSGLKPQDRILALNGTNSEFLLDALEYLGNHKGDSLVATVARGEEIILIPIATDTTGKMQVIPKAQLSDFYTITKRDY